MQKSGEGIKKIKETYQKLQLKLFRHKKSFVFSAKSLYKIKSSGQARFLSFEVWFFGNFHIYIQTQHILPPQKSSSICVHFRTPQCPAPLMIQAFQMLKFKPTVAIVNRSIDYVLNVLLTIYQEIKCIQHCIFKNSSPRPALRKLLRNNLERRSGTPGPLRQEMIEKAVKTQHRLNRHTKVISVAKAHSTQWWCIFSKHAYTFIALRLAN